MGLVRTAMRLVLALALLTSACGSAKEDRERCHRVADRYTQCVGEVLGDASKALINTPGRDGRAECAADPHSFDAYKSCMPATTCRAFIDCIMPSRFTLPERLS